MKLALIAITKKGTELALNISKSLKVDLFILDKYRGDLVKSNELKLPLESNMDLLFRSYDGIIFIMATGIVVRAISKFIVSKLEDPAIVVMDEKGKNIISLLSGHIGGANELTLKVSEITGGNPVITTATDINNVPAVDMIAKKNKCYIEDIKMVKYINAALANDENVALFTDYDIIKFKKACIVLNPPSIYQNNIIISNNLKLVKSNNTIILIPRIFVLGIGCKKNTPYQSLRLAIADFMNKANLNLYSIGILSSIDLKSNESAILEFCKVYNIEFKVFKASELKEVESKFKISEFVKKTVGVGNVCETSAYIASEMGKQIISKTKYDGITLSLFRQKYQITI